MLNNIELLNIKNITLFKSKERLYKENIEKIKDRVQTIKQQLIFSDRVNKNDLLNNLEIIERALFETYKSIKVDLGKA